jgi:ankyrin repeat protein
MPLFGAIRDGDSYRLRELIAAGANLRDEDEHGCFTALGEAAYLGRDDMVRLLLEAGAPADDSAHECALGAAALGGQVDAARALIEAGASIDGKSGSGLTPLMNAARMGRLEMVQYLVGAGADVRRRYHESRWEPSRSALDFAVENGYAEVAAYLLDHGALFRAEDYHDRSGREPRSPCELVELARRNGRRQTSEDDSSEALPGNPSP